MGFFGKKKQAPVANNDDVRGGAPQVEAPKANPAADKQRLKKIRNMKKKFDETVWSNAVDTMKKDIPQFTFVDKDRETGEDVTKYVLLGFDTRVVDDFANKSDDDVGSILTAIKASMNCVIEDALFDNEIILVIPTARSLAALAEFEDTFDMKFYIAYATEDHALSLETKSPDVEDDFIFATLNDVRNMLEKNIYVRDWVAMLQGRSGTTGEMGGISGEYSAPAQTDEPVESVGIDDAVSEDDYAATYGRGVEEDEEPAAEEPAPEQPKHNAEEAAAATAAAVSKAAGVASRVESQKDDVGTQGPVQPVSREDMPVGNVAPASAEPDNAPKAPSSVIQSRISKLSGAVQAASDQAAQDADIQRARQNSQVAPAVSKRPVFDMAAMDQYVTRKYYSDDLDLEISTQPFDAMFVQSNPYIPFVEEEGDGWLSGYVNNLRRDANARLSKLHFENLLIMRKQYMMIVSKHCEAITKSVATDDPKTRFGYARSTIDNHYKAKLAAVAQESEAYKKECEDSFQSRLKAEMENASNVARANFLNRYSKDHQRELQEIETDLRNNIESERVASIENLNNERRTEAKRQLDAGITEALRICADEYQKMLAQERKEYARLQALITDYMNENMALDDARVRVMAEEQRRSNEAVKVRQEYDAQMALAKQDFESRLAAIRSEVDQSKLDNESRMLDQQDRYEHSMQNLRNSQAETVAHKDNEIHLLEEQLSKANARNDELTRKFSTLEKDTEKKYTTQIDMLKSEREAWSERADHVVNLHKYSDRLKMTFMLIGMVAALAIGVILGCWFMAGRTAKANDNVQNHGVVQQGEVVPHIFIDGEEVDPSEIQDFINSQTEGSGEDTKNAVQEPEMKGTVDGQEANVIEENAGGASAPDGVPVDENTGDGASATE